MLQEIVAALRARTDLADWSVRQINRSGVQLYAVPDAVEARRQVDDVRYQVEVFVQTENGKGDVTLGSGNASLLPGDDIQAALDQAVVRASTVHNRPHTIPAPAPIPAVELVDQTLVDDPAGALNRLHEQIKAAVVRHPEVRMPAGELFAELQTMQFCNSQGIDASQQMTLVQGEFVLMTSEDDREVESFTEWTRRRIEDIDIEHEVEVQAQYAVDLLHAQTPPNRHGAVVLQGDALSTFLNAGVLRTLASAAAKYSNVSPWETGSSVLRRECSGDPLTVYANRRLPFGTHSNRFDEEGVPAQRVLIIEDNKLMTFVANQRYADYLGLTTSGNFGNIEIPAGKTPVAELLQEPYIEVVAFSWFNPNPISGEFSSEIRLGYLVEDGKRTPFRGGSLVGNVMDALANVRWSKETGFFGDYQGPTTARFGQLQVAGEEAQ